MNRPSNITEQTYYPLVKDLLEEQLKLAGVNAHLEITAYKKFSNTLKGAINRNRDIIFNFLREAAPDITGFIKGDYHADFIVVEIKNAVLKLDDIYQLKKYADLFDAKYALLVSTEEIPEELIRLSKVTFPLFQLSHYSKQLALVHYRQDSESSWHPKNPFIQQQ